MVTAVSSPGATMGVIEEESGVIRSAATMTLAPASDVRVKRSPGPERRRSLMSILVATMLPLAEVYDPAFARRWQSAHTMSSHVYVIGDLIADDFELLENLPSVISVPRRRSGLFFAPSWKLPTLGPRRPSRHLLIAESE